MGITLGSHAIHAKGGGLYDESINVPLFISYPPQRTGAYGSGSPVLINDFLSSSVDVLPYLYTLAVGSETWRSTSGSPIYYLRGRESIADAIYAERNDLTPFQRRTVEIALESGTVTLPYILHTTDEFLAASIPGTSTTQPSHAIAFRTADFRYTPAGGAKLGIYSYWPRATGECASGVSATAPYITTGTAQQFEYYDYTNGSPSNYGEVGNQALEDSGGPVLIPDASAYLTAFESIAADELYYLFSEFYSSAYTSAYGAYLTYSGLTGWCYTPPSGLA
jgi:hypothetical protein